LYEFIAEDELTLLHVLCCVQAAEFLGNRENAAAVYSRALLLFSFILGEAPSLPLNPPFLLAPKNKQHILKYMKKLESHLSRSQMSQPSLKQQHFFTK